MINLHQGDCRTILAQYADDYFHAIVSDPPAGIGFMNLAFDSDKGGRDLWIAWMQGIAAECYRVLRPGGHALIWALPRTSHWTATAWENAGFECRDRISHLFASGFPKSHNVGKALDRRAGAKREIVGVNPYYSEGRTADPGEYRQGGKNGSPFVTAPATAEARAWDGWGSALKPAIEDWWLLRKPLSEKSIAENVLKWGTGAINIDGCRVATTESTMRPCGPDSAHAEQFKGTQGSTRGAAAGVGRWPSHLIHDGSEPVLALFPKTGKSKARQRGAGINGATFKSPPYASTRRGHDDDGGSAARFFYCAKPSPSEKNADGTNDHPTVKSLALMTYLIALITPPGGSVLDPFMGSGTTIKAADLLGFDAVGIEMDENYYEIAQRRVRVSAPPDAAIQPPLFAESIDKIIPIGI